MRGKGGHGPARASLADWGCFIRNSIALCAERGGRTVGLETPIPNGAILTYLTPHRILIIVNPGNGSLHEHGLGKGGGAGHPEFSQILTCKGPLPPLTAVQVGI